jgi:hypothetical protein
MGSVLDNFVEDTAHRAVAPGTRRGVSLGTAATVVIGLRQSIFHDDVPSGGGHVRFNIG